MRHLCWLFLLIVGPVVAQHPIIIDPEVETTPVLIFVKLPSDALLEVDGVAVKQTGPERRLITPPFRVRETGQYILKATFTKDGKTVAIERRITVVGGQVTNVDFNQGEPIPVPPKKVEPKKEEPKKVEPKKEEPRKVEPKKEEPKKVEPKKEDPKPPLKLDVPYVPTPKRVVDAMLQMAAVKEGDVVYDLGCGDGRIVISAVKDFKAKKGLGIELAPERVKLSKENAEKAGVANKIDIREGDVLKLTDFADANVVTLYLLPEINEKLKPHLLKTLKPGSRVVSHDFDMGNDWKPDKELVVTADDGTEHSVYLWIIKDPAKKVEPKPEPKKTPEVKIVPPKVEPKMPPEVKIVPPKVEPKPDTIKVPYVPTPQSVVDEMLKFAGVKEGEVVYDLGCGDGRIPITAVKDFKAKKGFGLDIDPVRIDESKENAKTAKVEAKVEFRVGDVLQLKDVSEANVVTLYLFPELNERIAPMLRKTLKPGSRIVSHDFLMGDDWKPEKEKTVKDANGDEHTLYLWTIPEPKK